ncbi:MAG: DNA-3-methyladenine glycosylase [Chitinophagales bacterium]|nr:DNA-3-methyladenine glycosylase [Chitinophagales bacterium]
MKLPITFFQREDIHQICKELLGKYLMTQVDSRLTGGIITEVEAYTSEDRACHAFGGKRTDRTEIMFGAGGHAYVYLCYGIHHLFNIITHQAGSASGILVRSIEPMVGIDAMLERRQMDKPALRLTTGPGSMTQALGIDRQHYGQPLDGNVIWIEDRGITIPEEQIIAGPRVGVDYAGEDALLPWRYRIKGNAWVSKPK